MPGCSQSGTGFPDEAQAESASQNSALEWDAVSRWGCKGKVRPGIQAQTGMRFPVEVFGGKFIPELILRTGQRFPLKDLSENVSQKWRLSWDDVILNTADSQNETRRWRK